MICPNCGAQNLDIAKFCGKCGAHLRVKAAEPKVEPAGKTMPEISLEPPAPKKKKSKKAVIIAAVAVVLAAAVAAGVFLVLKPFDKSASEGSYFNFKPSLSFKNDGKQFINIRLPFYTEDGKDYHDVKEIAGEEDKYFSLNPRYSCFDNEAVYELYDDGLYRFDYKDGKYYPTRFLDFNDVDEYFSDCISYIRFPIAYDDSVYCLIVPELSKSKEPMGRICKVNKTSGKIERVGDADITAYSYTICNGWIYYLDNDMEKKGDKAGVYKMKTDGSEKTLLHREDLKREYGTQQILVIGDYLYYFENNIVEKKSSLNRVKTDGSGFEKLIELNGSETITTINYDGSVLYYVTKDNGVNKLNTLNTENLEKQENLVKDFAAAEYIDVIDGYLYVTSTLLLKPFKGASKVISSTDPNYPDKYSVRYKISENYKPEYFYAYKTDEGCREGWWQSE